MSKETYGNQKRPTQIKRDPSKSEEIYRNQKRPTAETYRLSINVAVRLDASDKYVKRALQEKKKPTEIQRDQQQGPRDSLYMSPFTLVDTLKVPSMVPPLYWTLNVMNLQTLYTCRPPSGGEVGGWGRDPKKCTGRDWGMGSSTI